MQRTFSRYVIAWIPMLLIAVANGGLRQVVFLKYMDEIRAHQLSTATGSIAIGGFVWAVTRIWPPSSSRQALAIGLIWLSFTIVFEFAFGRLVMHHPWERLFNDYDLPGGRVWVLFLVWLALAPYVFHRFRNAA